MESKCKSNKKVVAKDLCGDLIVRLDSLMSPEECRNIVQKATNIGWSKSASSGGGHGRTGREDPRTNSFCVYTDQGLAEDLWKRVMPFLRKDLQHIPKNTYISNTENGAEWIPVGVSDRIRVYKYNPGEEFPEHVDYKIARNVVKKEGDILTKYRQQSFFTLLVYLNEDFLEGTTQYWPDLTGIHWRFLRDIEEKPPQIVVEPKTGTGLIQEQNILHAGTKPLKGEKYILRTDIIHQKKCKTHPKIDKENLIEGVGPWERIFETSCKNYAD